MNNHNPTHRAFQRNKGSFQTYRRQSSNEQRASGFNPHYQQHFVNNKSPLPCQRIITSHQQMNNFQFQNTHNNSIDAQKFKKKQEDLRSMFQNFKPANSMQSRPNSEAPTSNNLTKFNYSKRNVSSSTSGGKTRNINEYMIEANKNKKEALKQSTPIKSKQNKIQNLSHNENNNRGLTRTQVRINKKAYKQVYGRKQRIHSIPEQDRLDASTEKFMLHIRQKQTNKNNQETNNFDVKSKISEVMRRKKEYQLQNKKNQNQTGIASICKQQKTGDFMRNLLYTGNDKIYQQQENQPKMTSSSWSQVMKMIGTQEAHSSYSKYEDPVDKTRRKKNQRNLNEFLIAIIHKEVFVQNHHKTLQKCDVQFQHACEFKLQYYPFFKLEVKAEIENNLKSVESGGLKRAIPLHHFTILLKSQSGEVIQNSGGQLERFQIDKVTTRDGQSFTLREKNNPLRENDVIVIYQEFQLSHQQIHSNPLEAINGQSTALGIVQKNAQKNHQLELFLSCSKPKWLNIKTPLRAVFATCLSTALREYRTLNMLEFYQLSDYLTKPSNSLSTKSRKVETLPNYINQFLENIKQFFNSRQIQAMRRIAKMNDKDIFLLQGPPGTGKTTTVVGIISLLRILIYEDQREKHKTAIQIEAKKNLQSQQEGGGIHYWNQPNNKFPKFKKNAYDLTVEVEEDQKQYYLRKPKILVCAPSNQAIDEITVRLIENGFIALTGAQKVPLYKKPSQGQVVRLGVLDYEPPKVVHQNNLDSLVQKKCKNFALESATQYNNSLLIGSQIEKLQRQHQLLDKVLTQRESNKEINFQSQIQLIKSNIIKIMQDQTLEDKYRDVKGSTFYSMVEKDLNQLKRNRKNIITSIKEQKKKKQKLQNDILSNAEILCCTLSTSGTERCQRFGNVDFLIIDEACQATQLSTLIPLMHRVKRMILVGDQKQLPAVVLSKQASNLGYSRSLFERILQSSDSVKAFMLHQQYRMVPEIRQFPSKKFYQNKLKDSVQATSRMCPDYINQLQRMQSPIQFLNIKDSVQSGNQSLRNASEADVIVNLYKEIIAVLSKKLCINIYQCAQRLSKSIGIITPYQGQKTLLRQKFMYFLKTHPKWKLNETQKFRKYKQLKRFIQIDTVDGFQGAQKQIIIISTVRAMDSKGVGFLKDSRRMNVAITRAKYFLFVVGNEKALCQDQNWGQLIKHMKDRNAAQDILARENNFSNTIQQIVPHGYNIQLLQKKYVEVQQQLGGVVGEEKSSGEEKQQQSSDRTICYDQSNEENQQRNAWRPKFEFNQRRQINTERQEGQIVEISDQDDELEQQLKRNPAQIINDNSASNPFILDNDSNQDERLKKRELKKNIKIQKKIHKFQKWQNIHFNR